MQIVYRSAQLKSARNNESCLRTQEVNRQVRIDVKSRYGCPCFVYFPQFTPLYIFV